MCASISYTEGQIITPQGSHWKQKHMKAISHQKPLKVCISLCKFCCLAAALQCAGCKTTILTSFSYLRRWARHWWSSIGNLIREMMGHFIDHRSGCGVLATSSFRNLQCSPWKLGGDLNLVSVDFSARSRRSCTTLRCRQRYVMPKP